MKIGTEHGHQGRISTNNKKKTCRSIQDEQNKHKITQNGHQTKEI